MNRFPTTITNNPARKGELAAPKHVFGPRDRYAVAPVHSRFDNIAWFVWDAENPDRRDYDKVLGYAPAVIRIRTSYKEAVEGLSA